MKQGIRRTGWESHYHITSEYFQLKDEQKKELKELRETTAGKSAMAKDRKSKANKKSKGDSNKQSRKTVASILAANKEKETNTASEVQEIQKHLVYFISDTYTSAVFPTKSSTVPPTLSPPVSADVAVNQAALQRQGILRQRRNKK